MQIKHKLFISTLNQKLIKKNVNNADQRYTYGVSRRYPYVLLSTPVLNQERKKSTNKPNVQFGRFYEGK